MDKIRCPKCKFLHNVNIPAIELDAITIRCCCGNLIIVYETSDLITIEENEELKLIAKYLKKDEIIHKCDECGKMFKDTKSDMDHCMDNNGIVRCKEC
jgi:uncharacterized C2H2 Zn-finger protein